MMHQLITPHDAVQDGVLLFVAALVLVNSTFLAHHLHEHKRWRENERLWREPAGGEAE
jgi:hypothetical protein